MKILFDLTVCQPIGNSKYHGGGIYGYILYKAIALYSPDSVVAYIDKSRFIPADILAMFSNKEIRVFDSCKVSLLELYQSGNYSFIYSPLYHPSYETIINQGIKMVVTFHGLRALEMNRDMHEYLYANSILDKIKAIVKYTPYYQILHKKYWHQYDYFLSHKKTTIITISEHSRSSLMYYYPNLIDKNIPVFYSPSTTNIDLSSVQPFREGGYYLVLSANRWLKNSFRAIQALDMLYEKFPNQFRKTIVVGLNRDSKIYKKVRNKEYFQFIDYVDNKDLERLYKGAYVFIYPTLNEGFGYPPLEAMKYGIPVICSPFSSVPEVCADSVIYFNPYSKEEISNRIIQLQNTEIYKKYSERSLIRYELITNKQNKDLRNLVKFLLKIRDNNE